MKVSRNITMKELFRLYIEKLGIGENILERKEIIFIFNAEIIDCNDETKLSKKLSNHCTITVVDRNNVIGAKINYV